MNFQRDDGICLRTTRIPYHDDGGYVLTVRHRLNTCGDVRCPNSLVEYPIRQDCAQRHTRMQGQGVFQNKAVFRGKIGGRGIHGE